MVTQHSDGQVALGWLWGAKRHTARTRRAVCIGSESRARTCDMLINSQPLCQLSYLGKAS